ncbi:hypothetical protein BLNAU_23687 [Blattamonas nauphoetae]|uniref:Uncharacterized protein n=1 Tax=Blattamonas nauphoetae TaxID=2049346 RepID=A0ABQ9WPI2_9EUKA|nr:hypothetical protein BLNAU_23687 [Blattamonas nauphoetae]
MMRQCFISSSRQTQEAAASSTVLLSQEQIHSPVVESKNLTALELAQLDLLPTVQRLRTADFRLFMQTIDRIFSPLSFVLAGRMRKAGRVLIAGIAPCPINVLTSADHIQLNHPNQRNSLMCPNEPYHPSTIRTCLTQHSPSCFSRSMDTAANRRFSFDERIETDDSDSYNWTTEITSFFRTNVGITPDSTVQYNNSAYHFAPHNSRSVSASSLTVIASSSLFSEIHNAWKEYQGWVFKNLKHAANCTHPPGFDVYGQPIVFSIHHSLIFFFSVYHFSPNHEQVPNDPIFRHIKSNNRSNLKPTYRTEIINRQTPFQVKTPTHSLPNMIGEQYSYISSRSISQIRTYSSKSHAYCFFAQQYQFGLYLQMHQPHQQAHRIIAPVHIVQAGILSLTPRIFSSDTVDPDRPHAQTTGHPSQIVICMIYPLPNMFSHPNKDPHSQHHIARKTLLTLHCKSPSPQLTPLSRQLQTQYLGRIQKYPSTVVDQTETLLSSQQWCRFYQEVLSSIEGQDKDGRGTRADMVILAARGNVSGIRFAPLAHSPTDKDLLRQFGNLLTASTAFEICLHPFGTHCIQAMIVRAGGNTDLEAQLGRHLYGHAFHTFLDLVGVIVRIGSFHAPTLEFLLSHCLQLTFPSHLSFVEIDVRRLSALQNINVFPERWKEAGPEVARSGKCIFRTLLAEGVEDALEQTLKIDRTEIRGFQVVCVSQDLSHALGGNVKSNGNAGRDSETDSGEDSESDDEDSETSDWR